MITGKTELNHWVGFHWVCYKGVFFAAKFLKYVDTVKIKRRLPLRIKMLNPRPPKLASVL